MTDGNIPRLRYFFDAGSGTCLWAGNHSTERQYGYAVELDGLPLSANTRYWLRHLISWYDTSLDWDNPGGESPWSDDERQRYRQAVNDGLERLRHELPPPAYEVIDETTD